MSKVARLLSREAVLVTLIEIVVDELKTSLRENIINTRSRLNFCLPLCMRNISKLKQVSTYQINAENLPAGFTNAVWEYKTSTENNKCRY